MTTRQTKLTRDRPVVRGRAALGFAKGSPDAQVLAEIAPGRDEIVLAKTSSSVFNSAITLSCVYDACAAETVARHEAGLESFRGYCRMLSTTEALDLVKQAHD